MTFVKTHFSFKIRTNKRNVLVLLENWVSPQFQRIFKGSCSQWRLWRDHRKTVVMGSKYQAPSPYVHIFILKCLIFIISRISCPNLRLLFYPRLSFYYFISGSVRGPLLWPANDNFWIWGCEDLRIGRQPNNVAQMAANGQCFHSKQGLLFIEIKILYIQITA